jgi:hypothetical protein
MENEVPAPEQRLCKKHERPIIPHNWKHGNRNVGCSRCENERRQRRPAPSDYHWGKKNYRITVKRRGAILTGGFASHGIELFNCCIGYPLISPNGAITVPEAK